MRKSILVAVMVVAAAACSRGEKQTTEPLFAGGDPVAGKQAFVDLGCAGCHEVYGGDLPKPTAQPEVPVFLGGNQAVAPARDEMIREIIKPSHRFAPGWPEELTRRGSTSRMPSSYAEAITVQQLVDLTAFLESRYGAAAGENVNRQR